MPLEIFPAYLLDPEKWEEVIAFLDGLPIAPRRKKQAFVMWAKFLGVALTDEMTRVFRSKWETVEAT